MSDKDGWGGVKVRRKLPLAKAFQWAGNGVIPALKQFLIGLDCGILVDVRTHDLYLKWANHTCHLPLGGWLLRSAAYDGSNAITYHKADEFFEEYEYVEPFNPKT